MYRSFIRKRKKLLIKLLILFCGLVAVFYLLKTPIGCSKSIRDSGWECKFPKKIKEILESTYNSICIKQNGIFESGVSRFFTVDNLYYFSCSISLPDAGKSCSKSEECLGGCSYNGLLKNLPKECNEVLVKSQSNLKEDIKKIVCPEMLVGKCTKEKMIPCSYWYEVDGNEIVSHFQACFMD